MTASGGPQFELATRAPGVLALSGVLSFETAAKAYDAIRAQLASGTVSELDLAGLEHSDSAGLACILALAAEASASASQLQITNPPHAMQTLARVSDVEVMLA